MGLKFHDSKFWFLKCEASDFGLFFQVNLSVSNKDAKSTGHLTPHTVAQYSVFVVIELMGPVSHWVYKYFILFSY